MRQNTDRQKRRISRAAAGPSVHSADPCSTPEDTLMGMFDTIHFEQPLTCSVCQAPIAATQTKAFECLLDDFRIGDCVGHAEEIRIVRERIYCNACRGVYQPSVYFVVYRGILVDVALDLPAAEAQLRSFSFERLILWYHDQYAKRVAERRDRWEVERFLREVVQWYEEGYDQMTPEERDQKPLGLLFLRHRDLLAAAEDPVAAVRAYLAERSQETEG
jgi:hypothetical protein